MDFSMIENAHQFFSYNLVTRDSENEVSLVQKKNFFFENKFLRKVFIIMKIIYMKLMVTWDTENEELQVQKKKNFIEGKNF